MDKRTIASTTLGILSDLREKEAQAKEDAGNLVAKIRGRAGLGLESAFDGRLGRLVANLESLGDQIEIYGELSKQLKPLASLVYDNEDSCSEDESLLKFQANVAALLDELIIIDGRDSSCQLCNADLYENCGGHCDSCPLPGIAKYAGIALPVPE